MNMKKQWSKPKVGKVARVVLIGVLIVGMVVACIGLVKKANIFGVSKQGETISFENEGLVVQGTVQATETSINTKVPGRIVQIFVAEGDAVKAGDKLVEIGSDELNAKKEQVQSTIEQAQAGLDAAYGQVAQAKAGVLASESLVEQAKAGVASSKALIEQVKAAIAAAEGKAKEASAGLDASSRQQEAAAAVQEKADNGARLQEIAQAQAGYDFLKSTYDRVADLEAKGAVSKQKLEEVKVQLDVAAQTLSIAKEGARAEDKAAASAVNEQAKAGVVAAQTRIEQAEAGVSASQAQLTQAMAGEQASQAQLGQAMAGLTASKATLSQAEANINVRKAQIAQAQGGLKEVEAYLNDTVIKAPSDGIMTSIYSNAGELVSTGTAIGTLSDMKHAWITVNVKETDMGMVKENAPVEIKLLSNPDEVRTGVVAAINRQPDFATKRATTQNGDFDIVSYGVKIKIEGEDETVFAGMTAYVNFFK